MNKITKKKVSTSPNYRILGIYLVAFLLVILILLFRLGTIMKGVTIQEFGVTKLPLGWHGLYNQPLNLPLNFIRSIDFKIIHPITVVSLRLPNVIFAIGSIASFYILALLWYGQRTAVMSTILFSAAAWTLHVGRYASFDVEYLFAISLFLLTTAILQKHPKNKYSYSGINLTWSILIFIPGMIWFIVLDIYRQRRELVNGYKQQKDLKALIVYILSAIIWIPLLLIDFIRSTDNFIHWLGLPTNLQTPIVIMKNFVSVFTNIFIKGPNNPELWLAKSPLLDAFSLVCLIIGIYFYAQHYKASRSRLMFYSFIIGAVLISLNGPVGLSALMPLIFLLIGAGIANLLKQWLQVFPKNPIARGIGFGLISVVIAFSVIYNLRAYYVAWPNNPRSQSVFDVRL